jgi:hypothetical protein
MQDLQPAIQLADQLVPAGTQLHLFVSNEDGYAHGNWYARSLADCNFRALYDQFQVERADSDDISAKAFADWLVRSGLIEPTATLRVHLGMELMYN